MDVGTNRAGQEALRADIRAWREGTDDGVVCGCWPMVKRRAPEASKESNARKPKPLDRPVSGSRMILGLLTITPKAEKVSYSSCGGARGEQAWAREVDETGVLGSGGRGVRPKEDARLDVPAAVRALPVAAQRGIQSASRPPAQYQTRSATAAWAHTFSSTSGSSPPMNRLAPTSCVLRSCADLFTRSGLPNNFTMFRTCKQGWVKCVGGGEARGGRVGWV